MKENNGEFTLKDFLGFLATKIWMVVIVAIIGGAFAYLYADSNKKITHSYSTSFFVESISNDGTTSNVGVSKQRVPLYMEIIANNRDYHEEILKELTVEERIKYGFSKDDTGDLTSLKKMASLIRTQQSGELEMFYVHVTASTEECAKRISEIITDISTKPEKENAVYKNIGAPSHIKCVDSPRSNGSSTTQNTKMSLIVGVFGGALLAFCALWIYFVFDNRIRGRRSLERNFDLPILGVIPRVSVDSMTNEAYLESKRRSGDEEI